MIIDAAMLSNLTMAECYIVTRNKLDPDLKRSTSTIDDAASMIARVSEKHDSTKPGSVELNLSAAELVDLLRDTLTGCVDQSDSITPDVDSIMSLSHRATTNLIQQVFKHKQ